MDLIEALLATEDTHVKYIGNIRKHFQVAAQVLLFSEFSVSFEATTEKQMAFRWQRLLKVGAFLNQVLI